ncbi:MAG TPA: hypothetical protein VGF79_09805 [Bacteroidia bacterium]
MKKLVLFAAILALGAQSCKEKEKETPKPSLSTRQQALIGKDWRIKAYYDKGQNETNTLPACIMDNVIYHFTDASTGYGDEGATKCDPIDPQKINLTWKLINNENSIVVTTSEGPDTFQLVSVSTSEMKMKLDTEEFVLKN